MDAVTTLGLALISVVMSVAAQFAFKLGMLGLRSGGATSEGVRHSLVDALMQPAILGGFALYGLSAVIWLRVLAEWDVSKAYPMVGMGFVFSLLVGQWLGEAVGAQRLAGAMLILIGVYLVSRS